MPRILSTTAIQALALNALLLVPNVADAQPISRTFYWVATGFEPAGAPVSPVTGSITVTFDPAAGNVHEVTSGILLNSLNINFADVMAFNYYAASDTLEFGGLTFVHEAFAGLNFSTGVDDFIMDLAGASATPINNLQLSSLGYSQTGTGYFAGGNPASDSISITVASLPEAASYATFGAGLVGAMAMRRRKSKV